MIATDLTTRRVPLKGGGAALAYRWGGEEVLVRDDALTVLRCIRALTDAEATPEARADRFTSLIFADRMAALTACDYSAAEFERMCCEVAWDVCGLDLDGTRATEEPVWDIDEDAAIIRTSLRQAYGIDWDEECASLSFAEFVALVGGCPYETPLGRAIYYRTPSTRPKANKHNRKEIQEWERLHKAYALHKGRSSRGAREGSDAAMRDAFAALKRAAR